MTSQITRRSAGEQWLSGGRLTVCAAFALLMLLSGCASRKEILGFQEDTRQMRADLDSLKQQQRLMQDALGQIDSNVRESRAKSEYGSTALEEKVQTLASRLDDILKRMDRSLAPLEEYLRRQSATDTSSSASLGTDYFDAAMKDLDRGNYDLAEVGFLQFLKNEPKSDLADDARYELGESYYARKMYDEAVGEYTKVIEMYPDGNKVPAAMLKLGLTLKAQGKNRDARAAWQSLITKFPLAEESKIAQLRLDELKNVH